ncbi:hypothetical protein FA95DRAFT_1269472 [Auriscalpium vulgare]|uniref:Uncharacterized protein n=1 Tax=Auriscalpium vulgare TaxID=40419 RepID=A0ACB8R2F8_9AGAM|nr:hypothetical protein FA95DRAFT_1269472 [Auriscalpium vulgare]
MTGTQCARFRHHPSSQGTASRRIPTRTWTNPRLTRSHTREPKSQHATRPPQTLARPPKTLTTIGCHDEYDASDVRSRRPFLSDL